MRVSRCATAGRRSASTRWPSAPMSSRHDDAMVVLGVGKNMVKAIRHWG
nr:DUF4007 family protein [Deltaproteobacteria bacterium]